MKKFNDTFDPSNHVVTYHVIFEEIPNLFKTLYRQLKPMRSSTKIIVEAGEVQTDPRFNVGYQGAVLIVLVDEGFDRQEAYNLINV